MYAVVRAGGRQFKVAENQVITVDRLQADVGTKIGLEVLMLGEGEKAKFGTPFVAGAKVEAEVLRHRRGPKIRAFNYKPKKNERRRWGHRQELTDIRIVNISSGKAKPTTETEG